MTDLENIEEDVRSQRPDGMKMQKEWTKKPFQSKLEDLHQAKKRWVDQKAKASNCRG